MRPRCAFGAEVDAPGLRGSQCGACCVWRSQFSSRCGEETQERKVVSVVEHSDKPFYDIISAELTLSPRWRIQFGRTSWGWLGE